MAVALDQKMVAMTGNETAAQAMRQICPDVVAAYPITPQTEIVQIFSTFVADGLVPTEFVPVESEHSAMSATLGAAAAGARAMTATSSQGLAFMWEVLYIAAGLRLPIVMPMVNRTLSGPINIHCDHSDSMGARDSGWLQIFSETAQEMYDNLIQAVRIAEHQDVRLPVMVMMDGFITSHCMENVSLLPDSQVKEFIGEYKIDHALLDVDNPSTWGPLALQDFYFELKRQQAEAVMQSKRVILDVAREFEQLTGRKYGFLDEYEMDDAEVAIVVIGSTAGTCKYVVNQLRKEGIKAGVVKIRVFRPFPYEEFRRVLSGVSAVAVLDRSESFSSMGGPVHAELKAAMYDADRRPMIINYIYGLGGRDVTPEMLESVYRHLVGIAETGKVDSVYNFLGIRD